jgi:cell division protein FtsZ
MWVVNTDAQALGNHACPNKLQIGAELTRGLGTGGKSELGEQAALESVEELSKVSSSSNNNSRSNSSRSRRSSRSSSSRV